MNLNPVAGDRWTRPGEDDLVVLGVTSKGVKTNRGHAVPLSEYLKLAEATVRNGGILHRTEIETEDCLFE